MTVQKTNQKEAGFTLVELAIVLMIIGLLIGGILRGQELMENARVTTTIQQTKAYDGAVTTFRDAYSALPGDITSPNTRLANCTNAPCSTAGDGNNIIGIATPLAGGYSNAAASENRNFWVDLAAVHLISGVNPTSNNPPATAAWGSDLPAAKIGGGFHVAYLTLPVQGTIPPITGHFLLLHNSPATTTLAEAQGTSAISALRAAQLDRKLDDGLPATGDVLAASPGAGICQTAVAVNATYLETTESRDCDLLIRVQN